MSYLRSATKWTILLLTLALLVSLIGCSCQVEVAPTPSIQPTPTSTTPNIIAQPGTLSSPAGEVLVQKYGSQSWANAAAGMKLEAGDRLKTGSDGTALIIFFEGSVMEVKGSTELLINEMSVVSGTASTSIRLRQVVGNTINRVEQLVDSASQYEVETPAGSAVVRGTIFQVSVNIDGNTTVLSVLGCVLLSGGGVTKIVCTGEESSVSPGGTPTDPSPVPTPTPISTPISTPIPTPSPTPTLTPTPTTISSNWASWAAWVVLVPTPTPSPGLNWSLDSETSSAGYQMEESEGSTSNGQSGNVTIKQGECVIWMASEAVPIDVTFPAGKWVAYLQTNQQCSDSICLYIGEYDGLTFNAFEPVTETVFCSNDGYVRVECQLDSKTVPEDRYFALKICNQSKDFEITIYTDGSSSLYSPGAGPSIPVSENSAVILLGISLTGLAAYLALKKQTKAVVKSVDRQR